MRQAIITKFHGPTNVRGSRVSARAQAGRIILSWDHALNSDENHIAAAKALAEKWGWSGAWFGGGAYPDGYVFVNQDGPPEFTVTVKPVMSVATNEPLVGSDYAREDHFG